MPNNNFEDETDTESNGSWYETDNESEYDEDIYDPEEPSLTKYNIVLCEPYNNHDHGYIDGEINYHYLTYIRIKNINNYSINSIRLLNNRLKLEIAECIYLPSEHCVSILKTHWLRLIQRKWKKIYINRKQTIKLRCNPNSLKYREIHGKWPNNCVNYPSLRGMLSDLPRAFSRSFS